MEVNAVPRPEPAAERAANMMRGLEWLMVPVVLALGFMLASFAVRNSEFWQHLATGRLITEGKYSFGKDPFSFESEGRTWVNHTWLYDVLVYKIYGINDDHSAVVYLKAAFVAVLALVMLLNCRPPVDQRIVPGTKANPTGWLAAIAVGVGIVAMGPRLLLHPAIASYLFLALTFFILQNSPRWPAYALPVSLAVLFVLWVNLDQWFFLGPALVAIFLAGEWLQQYLPPATKPDPVRLKNLAIALGVGLAACLLNPHHVKAFSTLPTELAPHVAQAMRNEKAWKELFIPTSDVLYFNQARFGKSISGFCYWAVMGLGLLGFGLNYQSLRVSQLLTWIVAAILPLVFNFRLVPFFVVVGAPIAVLNLHAFFARRPFRKGVTFATADALAVEEKAAPPAQEGWWAGAGETVNPPTGTPPPGLTTPAPVATAPSPAPASKALGGELTMTPETMLAMVGIMGRLLTVVAGLAAVAACWPGWLHNERTQRRVEWVVKPDETYVQVAERLQKMHDSGQLAPDARGLSLDLNVPNYCAWYAPSVRNFMDLRFHLLGHLSGDLLQVKRGLADRAKEIADPVDYTVPLRAHKINYVIVSTEGNDVADRDLLMDQMVVQDEEWALWYLSGRISVFGWHDPRSVDPAQKDPLRVDLVALGLGAKVERLQSPETYGVTREPPPDAQPEASLLNKFLVPPPPAMPTESYTAMLYLQMRDKAFRRANLESLFAFDNAFTAGWIALYSRPTLMTPFVDLPQQGRMRIAQQMALFHPLPSAVNVLAVREARRAALRHPNEGLPYLVLSLAYNQMLPVGPEIRRIEQLTALHQGLDRLPTDEADRGLGPIITTSWLTLYELHRNYGERDLAEEALKEGLRLYAKYPPLGVPDEKQDKHREELAKQLDKLTTELLSARDNFQLERDAAKRLNSPPETHVRIALNWGLVREALKIIEDPGTTRPSQDLLRQAIEVYLDLGRIDDAQQLLDKMPEQFKQNLKKLQIYTWIGAGDYARAGKGLEEFIAEMERDDQVKKKFFLAAKVFESLHFASVEPSGWSSLLTTVPMGVATYINVITGLEVDKSHKAETMAMRGMLALEEGDVEKALKFFRDATEMRTSFDGMFYAGMYRRVLERAVTGK